MVFFTLDILGVLYCHIVDTGSDTELLLAVSKEHEKPCNKSVPSSEAITGHIEAGGGAFIAACSVT